MKPQKAWAIVSGEIILPYTVRHTRSECLSEFKSNYIGWFSNEWEKLRRRGTRCVKIEMRVP